MKKARSLLRCLFLFITISTTVCYGQSQPVSESYESLWKRYANANKALVRDANRLLDTIESQLEKSEKDITAKLAQDKELKAKVERIATAKGIGVLTVTCIVAETQGFHLIGNRKQLTSFAGLDVKARQSGKDDPKHHITKKGNAHIRAALYMPALSAAHCNRQMVQTYGRICGKHPDAKMIGVTAIMRKMLLLVYSLWKSGEEYDEARNHTHTPKKKEQVPEYRPEDCLQTDLEPVDWNSTDEEGNPPF